MVAKVQTIRIYSSYQPHLGLMELFWGGSYSVKSQQLNRGNVQENI